MSGSIYSDYIQSLPEANTGMFAYNMIVFLFFLIRKEIMKSYCSEKKNKNLTFPTFIHF